MLCQAVTGVSRVWPLHRISTESDHRHTAIVTTRIYPSRDNVSSPRGSHAERASPPVPRPSTPHAACASNRA